MRCLKCGNELKDNEVICSNCGYNRNNSPEQDNQFATRNIGVYNQNPVDQKEVERKLENEKEFDELVQIYIGDKYYNFKRGKFSWCAFFLGPLYFLYRKLYAIGIILFIALAGINEFFSITTQGRYDKFQTIEEIQKIMHIKGYSTYIIIKAIVFLIIYIFLGISFKKLYFNEVVERIGKIKQDNPDLGFNQLTQLVKQKGGVNILLPVLIVLIPIILLLILVYMYGLMVS